jgi:hypothetical protein
MIRKLRMLYRLWRQRRAFERQWRKANPGQQLAIMIECLRASPELRRAFREALSGKARR